MNTLALASSLMMTGLIWLVQLVHYPSFHHVDRGQFQNFSSFHTQNITYIVMPLMAVELLSSLVMVVKNPSLANVSVIVLLAIIWLSTAFLSVPCHNQLAHGYDASVVDDLIRTNWIRTLAWTGKSAILLWPLLKQEFGNSLTEIFR
jgi:L-cystine uptake protein TcyP (sodium:dicarboxylate symporter family)